MPHFKRSPFVPNPVPENLQPDEEVFHLKLTNEIFRTYDEYFERMIACNSMVWKCGLTGKANLTFQEALESEKAAKKQIKEIPKALRNGMLVLMNYTNRGKILDALEDVFAYARDRYFVGEHVLAVIGNLWCPSVILRVIHPTKDEIEYYKQKSIADGQLGKNDYLSDETWGPHPDLFRYEVKETDPDMESPLPCIVEAIDVKREKYALTRDKCRFMLKVATDFNEEKKVWRVKEDLFKVLNIKKLSFPDIFVGPPPMFESSPGSFRQSLNTSTTKPSSKNSKNSSGKKESKTKSKNSSKATNKSSNIKGGSTKKSKKTLKDKSKGKEKSKKLTPEEVKEIEIAKKAAEKEQLKKRRKYLSDLKKLWQKPKEDLEVEDLKDLPTPDPVSFKVPNHYFGDFVMVLEFFDCFSNVLKVRDTFSCGLSFDVLERALTKEEINGPYSEILQILIRTLFRLQQGEKTEIAQEKSAEAVLDFEDANDADISRTDVIQQATIAAAWSVKYLNTPMQNISLDHLGMSEVIRLHLLSSGARLSEKDAKWRWHHRGAYRESDDPGLQLRLMEPQILKTLATKSVFDLSMREKLLLLKCLTEQILSYAAFRDIMDESFEQFKQARSSLKSLIASHKRQELEDNLWRQKVLSGRLPDPDSLNAPVDDTSKNESSDRLLSAKEIENEITKKDKEVEKRRAEFESKEAELNHVIYKNERRIGISTLGKDRAFRRYHVFSSIQGLFVEDDDEFKGKCLESPPLYIPEVDFNDFDFVKENFHKLKSVMERDGSNKENAMFSPLKISKKKLSSAAEKYEPYPDIFGICSRDPDNCPVHTVSKTKPKWFFFSNPNDLDELLDGLSTRGVREKELKQYLSELKDDLKKIIKKCPVRSLNTEKMYEENVGAPRKPYVYPKKANYNFGLPAGTSAETVYNLQLRDFILEMEEKAFLGGLGSLKVSDRAGWRAAIERRQYDPQVDSLSYGDGNQITFGGKNPPTLQAANLTEPVKMIVEDDKLSNGGSNTSGKMINAKEEGGQISPVIKDLACAILQLRQMIEPKFYIKPLGEKEDETVKRPKKTIDQEANKLRGFKGSSMERWETSLMASLNFSQLYLHLVTLENSIQWTRSILNARCRICRRKGDPENMLLCDNCNKGHHAYCLKPPLEKIPKGDWFCVDCRPPELEPAISPRSRRKHLNDDEIMAELDNSDDESNHKYKPQHVVEGCAECGIGGHLLCCDSCPLMYHLECLTPPMRRVPRGDWFCPECTAPNKSKTEKRSRKTNSSRLKASNGKVSSSDELSSEEEEEEVEEEEEEDDAEAEENEDGEETQEEAESDEDMEEGANNELEEKEYSDHASDSDGSGDEEVVKVKFSNMKKSTYRENNNFTYGTRAARKAELNGYDSNSNEDDDEDVSGRSNKRRSASKAVLKIAQAAKRLIRSDSKENESSENSNDSFVLSNGRKRLYEPDGDGSTEGRKRTRLQRMYTNKFVENGGFDNILMDRLLSDIMKHSSSWPFLTPVTKNEAPDYHELIKNPMDLGTIKYKLNSMVYTCNEEFISDLLLVFSNCFKYNPPENSVYKDGMILKAYCEKRLGKLGIDIRDSVSTRE